MISAALGRKEDWTSSSIMRTTDRLHNDALTDMLVKLTVRHRPIFSEFCSLAQSVTVDDVLKSLRGVEEAGFSFQHYYALRSATLCTHSA
jgi:hypothetical protein